MIMRRVARDHAAFHLTPVMSALILSLSCSPSLLFSSPFKITRAYNKYPYKLPITSYLFSPRDVIAGTFGVAHYGAAEAR